MSRVDDLREFKKLLDEGLITEDEYNRKKKQILELDDEQIVDNQETAKVDEVIPDSAIKTEEKENIVDIENKDNQKEHQQQTEEILPKFEESTQVKKKFQLNKKVIFACCVVLALIIGAFGIYSLSGNEVEKLMKKGNYEDALSLIKENPSEYSQYLEECCYKYGVKKYDEGDYSGAVELLNQATSYEDSQEKVKDIYNKNIIKTSVGSTFTFGNYNGKQITWRVLETKGNSVFIVSDVEVATRAYSDSLEEVTWEKSTIREWLNDHFYEDAFSKAEKEMINTTVIENEEGNNTEDRVFLLSLDEVNNYFSSNADRLMPSANKYGKRWYWLRSANLYYAGCADFVDEDGTISNGTVTSSISIRPAMWISVE